MYSTLSRTALLSAISVLGGSFVWKHHIDASENMAHGVPLPWSHRYPWQAFDHASLRRGFFVYKNVCANCHSLSAISYRHLIGVCLTEEEAKLFSSEIEVTDGPDDEGNMYERPGKMTDKLPKPYANKKFARFANNGAYPPDLSCIIKARHDGDNYLYNLLTGYRDAPAGVALKGALHYNPYFPGGAIGMAQALTNGLVEYDDGTEASISQRAKDVTTFLCWASGPETEERKLFGLKALSFFAVAFPLAIYAKKFKWLTIKTREIRFF